VAWTSDTRQAWATPWIGTPEFGTLTAQLVAWTLPPQDSEGIDVRFSPGENGELNVEVTSFDDEGGPRNFYRTILRLVSPDLEPVQTVLEQIGPGRYSGTVRADDPGAYLVRVAQTFEDETGTDAASRTLGIVSPAAEEYRRLGVDAEALAAFAETGGGRTLAVDDEESMEEVWRHDIEARAFPTPIWPWLLLLAILLVPLDVGVRRVALTRGDFRRARAWTARRVGLARPAPEPTAGLAELRAARERSSRRADRTAPPPPPPETAASAASPSPATPRTAARTRPAPRPSPGAAPAAPAPAPEAPTEEPTGETLAARLARRRRGG
jgi:hypothetical protein